ncbi:hypothetical protein V1291_001533 [Nitrobacteraceae bacterium AZCC 1564]
MSDLSVTATITADDRASPVLRDLLANIKKLEAATKSFNRSFDSIGNAGMSKFDAINRAAQAAAAQMRGAGNVSRAAAHSFASDWRKACERRVNDTRRMYASLERMERDYQRQTERRGAAERRTTGGRGFGGVNRLPAPRISTLIVGGAAIGAGVGSTLKQRMNTQAAETRAAMFGDLSSDEIKKLRSDFADKAGIRYGVGTTKAIDAAVEGLKAGVAKQFAGEFADLSLKAQAGLDIDSANTAKLLGRITTLKGSFNSKEMFATLNAVAVANNATAADGNEIVEALRRSLSAMTSTKMSAQDLAAFDASAISIGIQPAKAGTFLSYLTTELANAPNKRGQRAKDLSTAASRLGFNGRADLSAQMIASPTQTLLKIFERLMEMPEGMRAKIATLIGQTEWRDELMSLASARDLIAKTLAEIAAKPGFLDEASLKKIMSMQGRWASIRAAFGLVAEKIGAGFEPAFDQVSDAIINLVGHFRFDAIREHFAALVDGFRDGFGLKDWGEAVNSLAGSFDAGSVDKWRSFGRGFAEGIKEFADGLKTAFKALSFMFGGGKDKAESIGKFTAKLVAFTAALASLSPLIGAMAAVATLVAAVVGLCTAISAPALAVGVAALAGLIALIKGDGRPTNSTDDFLGLQNELGKLQRERKAKEEAKKKAGGGSTDFSGMRRPRTMADDVNDSVKKLSANIQRMSFTGTGFGAGGLQYASLGGGAGRPTSYNGAGGDVTSLFSSTPGKSLPNVGIGSGGIIRRGSNIVDPNKIPSFTGGGGSMADNVGAGLTGNAFLAARRARFAKEIKNDPSLAMHLAAMQATEGSSRGGTIESLMNRADMQGKTLRRMLGYSADGQINPRSFYGPIRRGELGPAIRRLQNNPKEFAKYNAFTQRALAGGHVIGGYTDQGLATDPNGSARTGIRGFKISPKDGNEFTDWVGPGSMWGRGRQGAINYRKFIEDNISKTPDTAISKVPSPAETIQNVPQAPPPGLRTDAGGGGRGSVAIHINGSNYDPETLATLVQRRIDESMNWRTHDTASEYT